MSEPNDTTQTIQPAPDAAADTSSVSASASTKFTLGASPADPAPTVSDHAAAARSAGFALHDLLDTLESRLFATAGAAQAETRALGHSLHEMVSDASTLAGGAVARLTLLLDRI